MMAIKWDNILPYFDHSGTFDADVLADAINQIPVIRDKNDQADRHRYQMENEFNIVPDNDQ